MMLNPIDRHYNALDCGIEPMAHEDDVFKVFCVLQLNLLSLFVACIH